jgi:hypothetical protein
MGLLTLKDHKLEINPDILVIPEFNKIWTRDKSKGKEKAYKEMIYVFYMFDFKSPYASYPEQERKEKIVNDIMGANWKPDKQLEQLCETYVFNQEMSSPSLRLLNSARQSVHRLADWLNKVTYEGDDATDPAKVSKTLSEIGKVIDSINKLEEKVKKEVTTSSRQRGGGHEGLFES